MEKKSFVEILDKQAIKIVVLIIIAALSVLVVGRYVKEPAFILNSMAIEDLDSKKDNVLKFTGISAGLSTALTMIPGDIATPIADELAELTGYFLIILAAITAEKYMITIAGVAAFYFLIPAGCILIIVNMFSRKFNFAKLGARMITFGILFYLLVPCSCLMSNMIEDTYEESIQIAEQQSEQAKQEIEKYNDESLWDKIKNASATLKDTLSNVLNRQLEVTAIMAVTCCIIPMAVVFVFTWLMKTVLRIDVKNPDINGMAHGMAHGMPKVNRPVKRLKGNSIVIPDGGNAGKSEENK